MSATELERYGDAYIERREVWTRSTGRVGGRMFIYDVYLDGLRAEPVVYGTDRIANARRIAKAVGQHAPEAPLRSGDHVHIEGAP